MTFPRPAAAAAALLTLLLTLGAAAQDDAGHDHDGEAAGEHEDVVELSAAELAEFGIVTAVAGPGLLTESLRLAGEIHPNDDRLAHLVPRYEGIVTEVHAHVGDRVGRDQVLAVIESDESLAPYPLRTLIEGTVLAKHITLGEAASRDRPSFVVADLSTVWLDLAVHQRDVERIHAGQEVRIPDGAGSGVGGLIHYVSPVVDPETRTATARVVLDNANGTWRPGMFVGAEVALDRHAADVVVPRTALFTVHGRTVVFAAEEHGFAARPVDLGRGDALLVAVAAGLAAGERFVSEGGFTLKAELEKAAFGDGHNH